MSDNDANYSDITPYAAAKITNIVLKSRDLDKIVKPQMFYTYAKKNVIESYTTDKTYFVGASFKTWLDKYVAKIESGETVGSRVDYDELATQYV